MNVLGRIAARLPYDDLVTIFVPLQYRARADAKPLAHLGRNGHLTLRGDPGMSKWHYWILPR